jgi:hypothetical protein
MAIVQYTVLYKYVHPTTKKPVTNETTAQYVDATGKPVLKYNKDYDTKTQAADMAADLTEQNLPSNAKYDMIFVYDGVEEVANYQAGASPNQTTHSVNADRFARCIGEPWFVASYHASLQSALNAADPLVKALGKNYVKVTKNVPLDITVGLE